MNAVKAIVKFDDPSINTVMSDVRKALNEIGQKYDVTFKPGNISYSSAYFKVTLNVQLAASAEDSPTVARRQIQLSQDIGFSENIFGRVVISSTGNRFSVVDINTRRSKYPIVTKALDSPDNGKTMMFTTKVRFVGEQPKNIWN